MAENGNELEINIDLNVPLGQENQVGRVDVREPPVEILQQIQQPPIFQANINIGRQNGQNTNNNHLNAARDRLFHAMLVRVALKYSSRVPLRCRQFIEGGVLFLALLFFFSLTFIHFNFTKSPITCLDELASEDAKNGIVRIEVVKNLDLLHEKEYFIERYVAEQSSRVCHFNPADVFRFGPSVIPLALKNYKRPDNSGIRKFQHKIAAHYYSLLSLVRPQLFHEYMHDNDKANDEEEQIIEDLEYVDPTEAEAHVAFKQYMKTHPLPTKQYEYVYRVEYAMLYGLLRLPPEYREQHNIPTTWLRIDSKSKCFGDKLSRLMMTLFVGYDDAILSAIRHKALNSSWSNPETQSMGYIHNLLSLENFIVVPVIYGRTSYVSATVLMIIFTFAISMLLRFSHHQIFVFIIDLLHMFELQQPLNPPVAPLVTVVLALVGMEAIMAEVFNDTSIAFYVILIVWVADQYDAICCHSPTSKKHWLKFFYLYQFFFYCYQYRFAGQYGGLALLCASFFILHSMIFCFHHYEMPLILYQDRVSQVLADLHAPQIFQNGMGTVEVQTITVAVHNRQPEAPADPNASLPQPSADAERPQQDSLRVQQRFSQPANGEPLSPSSVFDARGPNLVVQPEVPMEEPVVAAEPEPRNAEEIIAHQIVNDAMNELFNQHQQE